MKTIEDRILKTIGQAWAFERKGIQWVRLSKRDQVHIDPTQQKVTVWLWNTDIMTMDRGTSIGDIEYYVYLFDGGYRTVTTKSRLNAILAHYGQPRIVQRNSVWYIGDKAWTGGYSFTIGK
jgi:hypothetical protein